MTEQTYTLVGCSIAVVFCLIFMTGESIKYHRDKDIESLILAAMVAIIFALIVGLLWPLSLCILVPFYIGKLWVFLD